MATAHKVMVTVAKGSALEVFPYTTTDVNAASLLSPSGESETVFSQSNTKIVDYVHSTQGTCTQVAIYFNGMLQPIKLYTASSQPTVNRQVRNCPIDVPGGTRVKFVTLT